MSFQPGQRVTYWPTVRLHDGKPRTVSAVVVRLEDRSREGWVVIRKDGAQVPVTVRCENLEAV